MLPDYLIISRNSIVDRQLSTNLVMGQYFLVLWFEWCSQNGPTNMLCGWNMYHMFHPKRPKRRVNDAKCTHEYIWSIWHIRKLKCSSNCRVLLADYFWHCLPTPQPHKRLTSHHATKCQRPKQQIWFGVKDPTARVGIPCASAAKFVQRVFHPSAPAMLGGY